MQDLKLLQRKLSTEFHINIQFLEISFTRNYISLSCLTKNCYFYLHLSGRIDRSVQGGGGKKIQNYIEGYIIIYIYTVLELGLQWASQGKCRK